MSITTHYSQAPPPGKRKNRHSKVCHRCVAKEVYWNNDD